MVRRLRIAASVFFAVLAVALCVLWLLSLHEDVAVAKTEGTGTVTCYGSYQGYFYMRRTYEPGRAAHNWQLGYGENWPTGFRWISGYANRQIVVPYRFVLVITAAFACLPWVRFSLCAMFIATTLVALVLGLVLWVAQ